MTHDAETVERVARAVLDAMREPYLGGPPHYEFVANAALAAMPVQGVKVKPLVWDDPSRTNNNCFIAKNILGHYCVAFDDGWHATLYDGPNYWEWEPEQDPRSYEGPFAAQQACQADYERRILSTLDLPTPPVSKGD